jgi:hypothetical protein
VTLEAQAQPGGKTTRVTCPVAAPDGGRWSCDLSIGTAKGVAGYQVRAQATDRLGHTSAWTAWTSYKVDTTPPTVALSPASIQSFADGYLSAAELTLSGTATDDRQPSGAAFCLDGVTGSACPEAETLPASGKTGAWSTDLSTLLAGDGISRTLNIYGIDAADNRSTTPLRRSFILDTVPPQVAVTEITSTGAPALRGTVRDGGGVRGVYVLVEAPDGAAYWDQAIVEGTSWHYTPRLPVPGDYTLTVEAHDRAGNIGAVGMVNITSSGTLPETKVYLPVITRDRR